MRCPACTQRNSVAARNCKFCGQKFKKKGPVIPVKAVAVVVAVGAVVGVGSAVLSMFSGTPAPELKPIAESMAAGPKTPEDAQLMRVQLDNAVVKYLEKHGSLPAADLLTKLQSEVPSSAFEVLVFELPNKTKLVELACVLQPSDYLVVPAQNGVKVSRLSGLSVFDDSRLLATTPDPTLVLLGHSTGDQARQPQIKAVELLSSGEANDKTDKLFPPIKGSGTAAFVGTTPDIKIERSVVASAKDSGLFDKSVNFKDEPFTTTLKWKNGRYDQNVSLGTNEVGALYAVASSLVDPSSMDSFRQQLSSEVRDNIKAMEDKPVVAPGNFKISKVDSGSSRRSRRSRRGGGGGDSSGTYLLSSGKRGFEVSLVKSGRWSATGVKETGAVAETVATKPAEPEVTTQPEPTPEPKIIVQEPEKPVKVATTSGAEKKEPKKPAPEKPKKEKETASRSNSPGTITTETSSRVTMRSGPARRYGTIFDVPRGEQVKILGEQDHWYKISVRGREGWVYSSYVRKGAWKADVVASKKEEPSPKRESSKKKETPKVTISSVDKKKSSKNRTQVSSSKPQTHNIDKPADEPDFVP